MAQALYLDEARRAWAPLSRIRILSILSMRHAHRPVLTHYSQVDTLGPRYKSVNFGAGKSPGLTKLLSPKDRQKLAHLENLQYAFAVCRMVVLEGVAVF